MNMKNNAGKCIIFSAPSGAGKTTIVHELLALNHELAFSISACSRKPRSNEVNGKDYHFLSVSDFKQKIKEQAFIEWEEVYPDHFYGTLKKEIDRIWKANKTVVFDVDVYGGINLKKYFGEQALSFFIAPPSIAVLEDRLRKRKTETEKKIMTRLSKAREELKLDNQFDIKVINNDLKLTVAEISERINEFLIK